MWDFFEFMWLYSPDNEEEYEISQRLGEELNFERLKRLEKIKKSMNKATFKFVWEGFLKMSRNSRLKSQINCYANEFTIKRNF